jgi:hypothetical protein
MKTFSFSAAEAVCLMCSGFRGAEACHAEGAYHYAGLVFPLRICLERTSLFRLGSANVAISGKDANDKCRKQKNKYPGSGSKHGYS